MILKKANNVTHDMAIGSAGIERGLQPVFRALMLLGKVVMGVDEDIRIE